VTNRRLWGLIVCVFVLTRTCVASDFDLVYERQIDGAQAYSRIKPILSSAEELIGLVYPNFVSDEVVIDMFDADSLVTLEVTRELVDATAAAFGDSVCLYILHVPSYNSDPSLRVIRLTPDYEELVEVSLDGADPGSCYDYSINSGWIALTRAFDDAPVVTVSWEWRTECNWPCCPSSMRWSRNGGLSQVWNLEVSSLLWSTRAGELVTGDFTPEPGLEFWTIHSSSYHDYGDCSGCGSYSSSLDVVLTSADSQSLLDSSIGFWRRGDMITADILPDSTGDEVIYSGACHLFTQNSCPTSNDKLTGLFRYDSGEFVPVWCRNDIRSPGYYWRNGRRIITNIGANKVVIVDAPSGEPLDTIDHGGDVYERSYFETSDAFGLCGRNYDTLRVYEFPLIPTFVEQNENGKLPGTFLLLENYPNPFNAQTTIRFNLSRASGVKLEILNVLGQSVELLIDELLPKGNHSVLWDGSQYTSGVYYCRLLTEDRESSVKMLLLK